MAHSTLEGELASAIHIQAHNIVQKHCNKKVVVLPVRLGIHAFAAQ